MTLLELVDNIPIDSEPAKQNPNSSIDQPQHICYRKTTHIGSSMDVNILMKVQINKCKSWASINSIRNHRKLLNVNFQ